MNAIVKSSTRPAARRFSPQVFQLEDRSVPATFFLDPTLAGKTGAQTWNAGRADATQVTMGTTGFGTLQDALTASAASPGLDEIKISVGTISIAPVNANGTLILGPTNPVSLIGSGVGNTILTPSANTTNDTTAVLQADGSGAQLNITQLTFDGAGKNIGVGVFYRQGASGTISNARIANVAFAGKGGGFGVAGAVAGNLAVVNSRIEGYGRAGVSLDLTPANILGNTIIGQGVANRVNYGVQVFDNSTVLISGNSISNNKGSVTTGADKEVSAAIFVSSTSGAAANVTVLANNLDNNENAQVVGVVANAIDASKVSSNFNNLTNNVTGISADFTPSNTPIVSTGDFFSGVTSPSTGSVIILSPANKANPTVNPATGQPFTSIEQAEIAIRPTLFNFAASAGTGSSPVVRTYNGDGQLQTNLSPIFPTNFTGGIRSALADVNGDGVADTIAGTGPGVATRVVVVSGADNSILGDFSPFEASFTGGVFVTGADFNGDGKAEVIVTPDQGGGPRVKVYNGASITGGTTNPSVMADYIGLADTSGNVDANFRGGARASTGDMNGDGIPELLVAAGFTGGPRVTIWNGTGVVGAGGGKPSNNPLSNFFAFEQTLRDGAFVSAGDFSGDGKADLVAAGGPGGGPRVRIANGTDLLAAGNFGSLDNRLNFQIANFFAGDPNSRGGVRVQARVLHADGVTDLVTGSGDGLASNVRIYDGTTIIANPSNPSPTTSIDPFGATLAGGVYVG